MKVHALKTRIFKEGEDLASFILEHIPALKENSVLVVTSKIVALAEKRTAPLDIPGGKEALVKAESELAIETQYAWLTVKDGVVMASAGIDESNADGKYILLPRDSFVAAEQIRSELQKSYSVKNLGILITDSRTMPLRAGITGMVVGYAGIKGIRDYRNTEDLFGRVLKYSRTNVADSLAAAAVLEMGEGTEQCPLAVIEEASVEFCDEVDRKELLIPLEDDMYCPFFENLK